MIDFTKLGINQLEQTINPRDIFMGLTQKQEQYQYPRDVQGEVWKQWFEKRNENNIIIKMNTGSGKTIVALMILQSCINEGYGPAVYVVPDNYLVEQVVMQADKLGVQVVTDEDSLAYKRKKAILVINIQKLVNGKSVFGFRENGNVLIKSIIIDDMHACISNIREQFSVTIPEDSELYIEIVNLFSDSLKGQAEGVFQSIIDKRSGNDVMLVPFWKWQECSDRIYGMLTENREENYIKFKYNLIRDYLKVSHCYVGKTGIRIIPNCVPINLISSFDNAERKIYMSATLADDSPFVTVMDIGYNEKVSVITPEKANDIGERMIIVPKSINPNIPDDEVIRDAIAEKAKSYNVVVIVPSQRSAEGWKHRGGKIVLAENISTEVESIKSGKNGLYVFVNKYDGIDLPNEACRILVIDGLPNISDMNDRYEQDVVQRSERIRKEQIQRIEQGMGRGVRSNTDYCLVFLLGNQLTDILYGDDGYKYFSNATQKQFQLSEDICRQIEGESIESIIEVGDYILNRDKQWVKLSKSVISDVNYDNEFKVDEVAIICRKAFDFAIHEDYDSAIEELNKLINNTSEKRLKGYYKQLLAEYENFIDKAEAQQILGSAKKDNLKVLSPIKGIQYSKRQPEVVNQARNIVEYIKEKEIEPNKFVLSVDAILDNLVFRENTSKRFETAIRDIFIYIGFRAEQTEREYGKGPDDLVILGNKNYLIIECKNETTTETICKQDCNQLNGSYNWFTSTYKENDVVGYPIMIHNSNIFEYACSPNEKIRIITPTSLEKFKKNIKEFVCALTKGDNFQSIDKIDGLLKEYKLGGNDIIKEYTESYSIKNQNKKLSREIKNR